MSAIRSVVARIAALAALAVLVYLPNHHTLAFQQRNVVVKRNNIISAIRSIRKQVRCDTMNSYNSNNVLFMRAENSPVADFARFKIAKIVTAALLFTSPAVLVLDPTTNSAGSSSSVARAADQYRLPPIDRNDKNRCVLSSSAMGQANAARDKQYDLRECDLKGLSGAGKDMSGVIGSQADFSGVNFKEAQLSKGYLRNSKFVGTDFTNAVVDRASFDGSDLSKAIFKNAVLSGTTFTDSNLQDSDFSDSYLGPFDLKNLCANPTLIGKNPVTGADTKESAGCL